MKRALQLLATGGISVLCNPVQSVAQTAVTAYNITSQIPATASNTSAGWNAAAPYPTSTTYTNFYGQRNGGAAGSERVVAGFNIGANSYIPRPRPGGKPFDNVVINRHPSIPGDTVNTLYEYSASSGNNLYFEPSYLPNLQDVINSFVCNRGSDNTFSNSPTTQANIERIDLIINGGVVCNFPSFQGFLINERNGNDNFKVAAITSLNGSNLVSGLGNLVSVLTTNWGVVGPSFVSRVMSRRTGSDPNLRAKQDIASQTVSGVYISFSNLGITNGTRIYGLAVFPNDVTSAMDLVGLTNVPSNTDAGANGGLDMMAGGGYFVQSSILPLQLKNLEASVKNTDVALTWAGESQINVSHFEIERSTGTPDKFEKIGKVDASGLNQSYSFTDVSVPQGKALYYRLKVVDNDDSYSYSSVVRAAVSIKQSYQLIPSVAKRGEVVYLSSRELTNGLAKELTIMNGNGQVVYASRILQNGVVPIQTSQLSAGLYVLKIQTETEVTLLRFMVQ
jgi:hypothetical protein